MAQARTAPSSSSSSSFSSSSSSSSALLPAPAPPQRGGGTGTAPTPTLDDFGLDDTTTSPTTPTTGEPPAHELIGREALALISYPWRSELPGWTIRFLPARPGYLGGTWTEARRVEVYVRDGQSAEEVAFTLAHELGHAVDVTHFTDADRQRWATARGFVAPWWAGSGVSDYASGSGDFAESFAVWQIGGTSLSKLGGQPTEAQLAVLADLVQG